uniref:dUTPase-like domain-containing protein n=1 Tax=Panagrolaimus sp. ES5 TaxID=591445 RepID=A0AC34GT88_9BILA
MVNLEVTSSTSPVADEPVVKRAKLENLNIKNAVHEFKVPFLKINENAKAPFRGSEFAAGADIHSAEDCVVPKKGKYLVSTALKLALPKGTYGRVAPRSGLAFKSQIDIGAGVVDEDYRGEVKVLLFNFGQEDFYVKQGDRIAQLVCQEISSTCEMPEPREEVIEVVRKSEDIKMPTKEGAGMIVYSNEDGFVPARGFSSFSTGIHIALPSGYYGRAAPLNKLAIEHSIENYAGVIDEDYRGEIRVLLFNFSDTPFEVKKGDGIVQILCEKVAKCVYEEVQELSETTRGEGGFGSTGTSDKIDAASGDATKTVEKALSFEKIAEDAQEPVYGTPFAAGADVFSGEETTVPAGGKVLISTGIKLSVKPGHYARIAPRSGLAVKNFIDVGAGVEVGGGDEELKVLLFNYGDTDFQVKKGDRIAQIVAERIANIEIKEVKELSETTRGEAGFGSTGIKSVESETKETTNV